jgi:hypothetical protein
VYSVWNARIAVARLFTSVSALLAVVFPRNPMIAGNMIPAKMPMIAITVRSSIKVNPHPSTL